MPLGFADEAGPDDFVDVPPVVPHHQINYRDDAPVEARQIPADPNARFRAPRCDVANVNQNKGRNRLGR